MGRFADKTALVTGSTQGLGEGRLEGAGPAFGGG